MNPATENSVDEISRLFQHDDKMGGNEEAKKLWEEYMAEMKNQENYLKQTIEIQPVSGFVCKSTITTKQNDTNKAFINICSHQLIGRSSQDIDPNTGQMGLRVPVSCGEGRMIFDQMKNVNVCVFDAVFHPDTIKYALSNKAMKNTICSLAIHTINEKLKQNSQNNETENNGIKRIEGRIDSTKLKFPKLVYKGENGSNTPEKQRIRKDGSGSMIEECDNDIKTNETNDQKSQLKEPNSKPQNNVENHQSNSFDGLKICLKQYAKIVIHFNSNQNTSKLKFSNIWQAKHAIEKNNNEMNPNDINMVEFIIDFSHLFKNVDINLQHLCLNCNDNVLELDCSVDNQQCQLTMDWKNDMNSTICQRVNSDKITAKFVQSKSTLKIKCFLS